jgi:two-component system, sensor histidine kinase PdtaS
VHARIASSPEAREALRDANRRIRLLADVHEKLQLNTKGSREVDVGQLLRSLCEALRQSFDNATVEITLRLDVESLELSETMAIPLALVANELATNAYKHAFPHGLGGIIDLSLKRSGDSIVLLVSDNGVGIRPSAKGSGMGQKLIQTFSTHLRGKVVYSAPEQGSGVIATLSIHCSELSVEEQPPAPLTGNAWQSAL